MYITLIEYIECMYSITRNIIIIKYQFKRSFQNSSARRAISLFRGKRSGFPLRLLPRKAKRTMIFMEMHRNDITDDIYACIYNNTYRLTHYITQSATELKKNQATRVLCRYPRSKKTQSN